MEGVNISIEGANLSYVTTTDKDGYYELNNLFAGHYRILYEKEGYTSILMTARLEKEETEKISTLTMDPFFPTPSTTPTPEVTSFVTPITQGSISGNVINMRGYPIESAKIRLKGIKTKILRKAVSDEDGLFEFADLEEDVYILRVLKKSYKSFRQAIELRKGENLDVEIEMIRGRL